MPRSKFMPPPEDEPQQADPADKIVSGLAAAMGDNAPKSLDDLKLLLRQAVNDELAARQLAATKAKEVAENLDLAFDGQTQYAGLKAIRGCGHPMVTGMAPDPSHPDPRKAPLVRVHEGVFNMPWVDVVLPWSEEEEELYRTGKPLDRPKIYTPQINGLSWRVVAGRPQKVPLPYAEVLASAGAISYTFLPEGNAVRNYLARIAEDRRAARAQRLGVWNSIGVRGADITPVEGVAPLSPDGRLSLAR